MRSILQFFVPNNEEFYDLLEAQAKNGVACAREFKAFTTSFSSMPKDARKKKIAHLKELERKSDKLQHTLTKRLQTSFVTPIDRDFLYQLTAQLEDQVDIFYDAARKVREFQVTKLPKHFEKQADLALQATMANKDAVLCLRGMESVEALHQQVHDLEEEADRLYSTAMYDLFSNAKDPIEVIKEKELYEELEDAIDKAKHIVELIQGIVISHA